MWISEHVSGSSCQVAECGLSISPRYWVTTGWSHQPLSQLCNLATSFRMYNWVLLRSIWRADKWQFEMCPRPQFSFQPKTKGTQVTISSLQLERARGWVLSVQMDHFRLNRGRWPNRFSRGWEGVALIAECKNKAAWCQQAKQDNPPPDFSAEEGLFVFLSPPTSVCLTSRLSYHTYCNYSKVVIQSQSYQ